MKKESEIIGINRCQLYFSIYYRFLSLCIGLPQKTHWLFCSCIGKCNTERFLLHLQKHSIKRISSRFILYSKKMGGCHKGYGEANEKNKYVGASFLSYLFLKGDKEDIIKIHGLKGLVEELKAEVARLSTFIPDAEESKESVPINRKAK